MRLAIVLGAVLIDHRLRRAADVAQHLHHHRHALLHVLVMRGAQHADEAEGPGLVGCVTTSAASPAIASTSGCVRARTVSRMATMASPSARTSSAL